MLNVKNLRNKNFATKSNFFYSHIHTRSYIDNDAFLMYRTTYRNCTKNTTQGNVNILFFFLSLRILFYLPHEVFLLK